MIDFDFFFAEKSKKSVEDLTGFVDEFATRILFKESRHAILQLMKSAEKITRFKHFGPVSFCIATGRCEYYYGVIGF